MRGSGLSSLRSSASSLVSISSPSADIKSPPLAFKVVDYIYSPLVFSGVKSFSSVLSLPSSYARLDLAFMLVSELPYPCCKLGFPSGSGPSRSSSSNNCLKLLSFFPSVRLKSVLAFLLPFPRLKPSIKGS